jgi:hypothetical protein
MTAVPRSGIGGISESRRNSRLSDDRPNNAAGLPPPPCSQCHGAGWHLRCHLEGGCRFPSSPICHPACRFGSCDRCGGSGKDNAAGLPPPLHRSIAGCGR